MKRILIVDDEKHARDGLAAALGQRYGVATAPNGQEAMELLKRQSFDLVLTDLRMSGPSGLDVISFCRSLNPPPQCVLLTAYGDIATAVRAMKLGAADFITKPIDLDSLEATVALLLDGGRECRGSGEVVWRSPAMGRVLDLVRRVASSDATVMLIGETGVGKEVIANEIHRLSRRSGGPFVPINGSALPPDMIESELFGHERGAFTDAHRQHLGYFERADGGTLFFDEVGELPSPVQVKLLRVLETKRFVRLGGQEARAVDVRFISATHRDLEKMVRSGDFREDLFYRLNVIRITVPPLRERPEDLLPLMDFFLRSRPNRPQFSPDVLRQLMAYRWPGNVRELRNFCDYCSILHGGETVQLGQLDGRFFGDAAVLPGEGSYDLAGPTYRRPGRDTVSVDGGQLSLERALEISGGNLSRAAKLLGISRSTFYRRLRQEGHRP